MSVSNDYRRTGYFIEMQTNSKEFAKRMTARLKRYDNRGSEILEEACKIFVAEARERLINSGYIVSQYSNNIDYKRYGNDKYRIYIKENNEKEIMYFLEFGTGLVGEQTPHPKANIVGWKYVINPDNIVTNENASGVNSLGMNVGQDGWFYFDEDTQSIKFTSGLIAVRYLYDTMKDLRNIITKATRIVTNRNKGA
jgi:hypothetical protein